MWPSCYLLRVELALHHLHEVLIRHGEGDVRLAAERTSMYSTAAVLQIDGWTKAEDGINQVVDHRSHSSLLDYSYF